MSDQDYLDKAVDVIVGRRYSGRHRGTVYHGVRAAVIADIEAAAPHIEAHAREQARLKRVGKLVEDREAITREIRAQEQERLEAALLDYDVICEVAREVYRFDGEEMATVEVAELIIRKALEAAASLPIQSTPEEE